jgi:hypothetical protein
MTPGSAARPCGYCGEDFDPDGAGRLYCTPEHQRKAADRRRHGRDQRQPPERTLSCPWCGVEFTTRLGNQVFCTAGHRRLAAAACGRRRGFLTLLAAQAAAPGYGPVEPYLCPGAETRHWHLRSVSSAPDRNTAGS